MSSLDPRSVTLLPLCTQLYSSMTILCLQLLESLGAQHVRRDMLLFYYLCCAAVKVTISL